MTRQHPVDQTRTSAIPFAACFSAPGKPLPLNRRLQVHNRVVQRIRAFLQEGDFVEVPVPTLTAAALSGEATDSLFCCEYFDRLAFPRISGQLRLVRMVQVIQVAQVAHLVRTVRMAWRQSTARVKACAGSGRSTSAI